MATTPSGSLANTNSDKSNAARYIDVHAHVFPDFYEAALKRAGINDVDGWTYPKWSPEAMFKAMDDHKIEAQLLSVSSPGISFAEGDDAKQLARRLNEYMAGLVKEHSPRLGSMAILPLPDVEASLAEIEYAFDTLDMDGVGIISNYNGVYLADAKIAPVLEELNRRKAVAFVHPTIPPGWRSFAVDIPAPVMEYIFDSTRMAQQLVSSGAKAKFPDIAIIVCHGGGTLPISHQRLVKYWMDGKNQLFDTFYYELTATTEHEQLAALLAMTAPDRCMMGFDFPFMKPDWFDPLQGKLESYGFTPEELKGVIRNNALRLFPKLERRIRES
ncbi:amidohydrolase family protein [Methylobacterium sp. WL64]|uniref:amidohydrolase family protein n=1 Tax=Methylobacterium sp. WL64 TaxID=2603894 RepID=UPI00164F7C09|nr:amidohydrolase family protein [Methylobacterium sp. WL64]